MAVVGFIIWTFFVAAMLHGTVQNGRRGITTRGKQLHPNQYDPQGINRAYVAAENMALRAGKSRREASKAGREASERLSQYLAKYPPPIKTKRRR